MIVMLKKMTCTAVVSLIAAASFSSRVLAGPPDRYEKISDGIIVTIANAAPGHVHALKLQAVTSQIIHVTASPSGEFPVDNSLVVVEKNRAAVKWEVVNKPGQVIFQTPDVHVIINTATGTVSFTDKAGKILLNEKQRAGSLFANANDGTNAYKLSQTFDSPADEAFYGLGQQQNGYMNYKNQNVELLQQNTNVAIPFLLSTRHYGLLWDNYSISRFGDSREYQPLSALQLFTADGKPGGLTARYMATAQATQPAVERVESGINYDFLPSLKNVPAGYDLQNGVVSWQGSIAAEVTGVHKFLLYSGGYAKVWIDGQLQADKWRQCWNPCTTMFDVPLVKGKKTAIKIEWTPDGGESFISLRCLTPRPAADVNTFSFNSEVGDAINYYFFAGNNMDELIGHYRDLTGKAPIVPLWALGLWQSRERYKTQDDVLSTMAEFRKRQVPIDNIVMDWQYWVPNKWGTHEFDSSRFSDPVGMIRDLHDKYNAHFMISVWPKFYTGTQNYETMNSQHFLYTKNIEDGRKDWLGYVSTFYDAFNPAARKQFWSLMDKKLFSIGIDAWWMDATEPDIHSNTSIELRKELMTPSIGTSSRYFNAFPLENARAVYEGQRSVTSDKRVFILTRSAFAGQQRYAAATWSGDIGARWHDMKNQIAAGLNFSMSGLPYWTMDIGGFSVEHRYEHATGADLDEFRELNARWFQFGAFVPLLRVHGQFPYREVFNIAPEDHPAYKSILYYDQLRYRLLPYLYSIAAKTYFDNYTIMRGLIMDFPADTAVRNIADEYMFGPDFLVNPVYTFKARNRSVYLPAGNGWYDFYTGRYNKGGQRITADAPYERMPLFVKEGAIVPVGPALQYTSEKKADTITLFVYTGRNGAFKLYEDEGTNYNYEKAAFATIPLTYNDASRTLTIGERVGSFAGMREQKTFRIVWVGKNRVVGYNPEAAGDATVTYKGQEIRVKVK